MTRPNLNGRSTICERGVDVAVVAGDVANRDHAHRLIDDVVARTGRVDVLINNLARYE